MIAIGLAVEAIAAALTLAGLVVADGALTLLWTAVVTVLVGLAVTMVGVRRARPSRHGWVPPSTPAGGAAQA